MGSLRKARREERDQVTREIAFIQQCIAPVGRDADNTNQPRYEYRTLTVRKAELQTALCNWGAAGWASKVIATNTTVAGHSEFTIFLVMERKHERDHT